jgi:hypothetical protein
MIIIISKIKIIFTATDIIVAAALAFYFNIATDTCSDIIHFVSVILYYIIEYTALDSCLLVASPPHIPFQPAYDFDMLHVHLVHLVHLVHVQHSSFSSLIV